MEIDDEEVLLFITSSLELGQTEISEIVILHAWSEYMVDVTLENAETSGTLLIENNKRYFDNKCFENNKKPQEDDWLLNVNQN